MPGRKSAGGMKKGGGPGGKRPGGRGKKQGSVLPIIAAAIATVIIGIILLSLYGQRLKEFLPQRPGKGPEEARTVTVYFSDSEGMYLSPEKRGIRKGDLRAEVRGALAELIRGPAGELGPTVPEGTRLLEVTIKGGIAYVDFSREMKEGHRGGSTGEILAVYSIVNTVTLNFPEIKEVQILVDSRIEKTLAGHIDISRPLWADKKFIKG